MEADLGDSAMPQRVLDTKAGKQRWKSLIQLHQEYASCLNHQQQIMGADGVAMEQQEAEALGTVFDDVTSSVGGAPHVTAHLLESLPRLVHQQIARRLAELGSGAHFTSLRLCSRYWNALCNEEIGSVLCNAEQLGEAMFFMCGLPKLEKLTIRGSKTKYSRIEPDALCALTLNINSLELAAGLLTGGKSLLVPSMKIENIQSLLLPRAHNLRCIRLINCRANGGGESSVDTPGFFSRFPCLTELSLRGILTQPSLVSLDLGLCKLLRELTCIHNVQLTTLAVLGCAKLTWLDCSSNELEQLLLPADLELQTFNCSSNRRLGVVGGASFLNVHCSNSTYLSLPAHVLTHCNTLKLEDPITWEFAGNEELRELVCTVGPIGSIDLTRCTSVQLHLTGATYDLSLPFTGRSAVQDMHTRGIFCLGNMTGFTRLTDLYCFLISSYKLCVLDLSPCSALRKAHLMVHNHYLTSLNVTSCLCLEELRCVAAYGVTELNLINCTNLTVLECTSNGLSILDVSCCHSLTSLDVSSSKLLVTLNTGSLELTHIITDRCPKLRDFNSGVGFDGKESASLCTGCADMGDMAEDYPRAEGQKLATAIVASGFGGAPQELSNLFETLPRLVLQEIVSKLAELGGGAYFRNLRLCSHNWKAVCDGEIGSVICSPEQLMEAVPFTCGLPRQVKLTIKDSAIQASKVGPYALKTLDRTLRTLELAVDRTDGMDIQPLMTIESFSSLVLPWTHSLQQIHLLNCNVLNNGESSLDSPGFFARFPCLVVLRLCDNVYAPELTSLDLASCKHLRMLTCTEGRIMSLDVTGCKALTYLDCWNNRLPLLDVASCAELSFLSCSDNLLATLDVTACPNLANLSCNTNGLQTLNLSKCKRLNDLDCHSNQLSVLDLVECAELTHLDCNCNMLETLLLPATVELGTMHCAYNTDSLVVLGGTVIQELLCSASTYRTLSTYVQVNTLELEGLVDWDMAGNVKLQELTCDVGPLGSITLTGCNAVEVTLETSCTSISLLGREAVHKLTLTNMWCLNDMTGFTNLTDLHCNFLGCSLSTLDFSVCGALRKVHAEDLSHSLVFVNLAGCACLEELQLLNAYTLSELNLASCVNLTMLTCTFSRLTSLDASCCPLLTNINFCHSHELITLSLHSLARLDHVDIDDCPKLQECEQILADPRPGAEISQQSCTLVTSWPSSKAPAFK